MPLGRGPALDFENSAVDHPALRPADAPAGQ